MNQERMIHMKSFDSPSSTLRILEEYEVDTKSIKHHLRTAMYDGMDINISHKSKEMLIMSTHKIKIIIEKCSKLVLRISSSLNNIKRFENTEAPLPRELSQQYKIDFETLLFVTMKVKEDMSKKLKIISQKLERSESQFECTETEPEESEVTTEVESKLSGLKYLQNGTLVSCDLCLEIQYIIDELTGFTLGESTASQIPEFIEKTKLMQEKMNKIGRKLESLKKSRGVEICPEHKELLTRYEYSQALLECLISRLNISMVIVKNRQRCVENQKIHRMLHAEHQREHQYNHMHIRERSISQNSGSSESWRNIEVTEKYKAKLSTKLNDIIGNITASRYVPINDEEFVKNLLTQMQDWKQNLCSNEGIMTSPEFQSVVNLDGRLTTLFPTFSSQWQGTIDILNNSYETLKYSSSLWKKYEDRYCRLRLQISYTNFVLEHSHKAVPIEKIKEDFRSYRKQFMQLKELLSEIKNFLTRDSYLMVLCLLRSVKQDIDTYRKLIKVEKENIVS